MAAFKEDELPEGRFISPVGYTPFMDLRETETAIKFIKANFQDSLAAELNLSRVSAPLIVLSRTGVNDHLSGTETPIRFNMSHLGEEAEIVQSLAKWKRVALGDYGFEYGEGLYTDMNALRPDEILDNLHSIYVDQWDWEQVISADERNLEFLKRIVRKIYRVIKEIEGLVCEKFPQLPEPFLPEEIHFIHSEDLQELYPELPPMEREHVICREKAAVFIIGIGAELKDAKPHDQRAADYDDWITNTGEGKQGLNGDILIWYPLLECAFELSSMGIRVDADSLLEQLEIKGESKKNELYYHKRLLSGQLPLTIGGGIGQSRLCMLYLRKAHIGEVQSSIWPDDIIKVSKEMGIFLL